MFSEAVTAGAAAATAGVAARRLGAQGTDLHFLTDFSDVLK